MRRRRAGGGRTPHRNHTTTHTRFGTKLILFVFGISPTCIMMPNIIATCCPKTFQDSTQNRPRPDLEPRWPQDSSPWIQDSRKTPQLGAKMAPGCLKLEPKWTRQDGLKVTPRPPALNQHAPPKNPKLGASMLPKSTNLEPKCTPRPLTFEPKISP